MRLFVKVCQIFGNFLQKLDFLKITPIQIFSSKMMLGSWNLDQGYLYIVSKNLWNRFLNFWFFWKYVRNFGQNGKNVRNFGQNRQCFQKKSMIQKSVPQVFKILFRGTSGSNFSFLASFLKKKSVPAWFWENRIFVKNC